ncbi:MAG: YtcA family [Planctomycetota bacterium]|jgi:hypothetical protein
MKAVNFKGGSRFRTVTLVAVFAALAGCNPNLDVDGALVPAWLVAMVVGVLGTAACRAVLIRTGIDRHLVARPLVYVSWTVLCACLAWLAVFRY